VETASNGQQAMDKSVGLQTGGDARELVEIRASQGFGQTLADLWRHRELLYFLVWKDIKVKYKQTVLGAAWAVLQPLLAMLLFTLLFGRLAKLPSDGLPYPVFYYTALLTWTYFSTALVMASNSLVMNTQLITKVYFPRILLPSAAVAGAVLDLAIASVILLVLLVVYQMPLTWHLLLLPCALALLVLFTFSIGQFLAALCVNYRDIKYALPFIVQMWFFASPVVYPLSMVPEQYRWVPSLNPMVGVIELVRALVADRPIPWQSLGVSGAITLVALVFGLWYFNNTERRFADVI
jgi:homopolymeric O-antigen transport system permease protein